MLDIYSPMNRNPQAGRQRVWFVQCGDKIAGDKRGYQTLAVAKTKAKALHDILVKVDIEEQQRVNPLYGRF